MVMETVEEKMAYFVCQTSKYMPGVRKEFGVRNQKRTMATLTL